MAHELRGIFAANHKQSNSYYRWSPPQWARYLNDLKAWGLNALGIYPMHFADWTGVSRPWSDAPAWAAPEREAEWRQFWLCQVAVSQMARSSGVTFALWVPPNDVFPDEVTLSMNRGGGPYVCPSVPEARAAILSCREKLIANLPHVDVLFIPAHDNGGCPCSDCTPWVKTYLKLVEETADVLRRYHPRAEVWISNQGLEEDENRILHAILKIGRPGWLSRIAFGPHSQDLPALAAAAGDAYPLVLYPDITHAWHCQHPVPEFHPVYRQVYRRDAPSYRPAAIAGVFQRSAQFATGSIPYSEGIHDDLNKAVWLSLAADPSLSPQSVVASYCQRHFPEQASQAAERAVPMLERNWELDPGDPQMAEPLGVLSEVADDPALPNNWRWRMLLLRARLDAAIASRVRHDRQLRHQVAQRLTHGEYDAREAARAGLAMLKEALARPQKGISDTELAGLRQDRDDIRSLCGLDVSAVDRIQEPLEGLSQMAARLEEITKLESVQDARRALRELY